MPRPGQGLYAPRFVDIAFAIMGIGAGMLLALGSQLPVQATLSPQASSAAGFILFGAVLLTAFASCLVHHIDRRGWDDYMGPVITHSAMIAIITLLLVGVGFDFLLAPNFGLKSPDSMIQGMVPIACLSWAIGYFFLRWKGTAQ